MKVMVLAKTGSLVPVELGELRSLVEELLEQLEMAHLNFVGKDAEGNVACDGKCSYSKTMDRAELWLASLPKEA